jgi:hypothetical protein
MVAQFKTIDLYPQVAAPIYSQHGGEKLPGATVSLTAAAGQIYFTTNGSDPLLPNGSLSPAATLYTGPITLASDTDLRARALAAGAWSALTQAAFTTRPPLRITEILYHASSDGTQDDDDFDFIELTNVGSVTIDLRGMSIAGGVAFDFDSGTVHSLGAGQAVVIVGNIAAFSSRNPAPEIIVAGEYSGRLNNMGEPIEVLGPLGQTIVRATYSDEWYSITDDEGFSLVPRNEKLVRTDWSDATLWRPSQFAGGSPGDRDHGVNPGDVVISEALTHSDGDQGDWIELQNTTSADINIGGWYLSEERENFTAYQIAPGTVLPAGGFLVFTQGTPDIAQRYGGTTGFALSKVGDTVYVTSSGRHGELGGYRIEQTFTYGFNSSSFVRHTNSTGQVDYVVSVVPTPGTANAQPTVDHIWDHGQLHLSPVISEIMYFPAPGGDEYIEIYNPHDSAVHLDVPFAPSWRFTEGIVFNFPDLVTLPAHRHLLVVPNEPAVFRDKYNVPAETQILGPYSGDLLNSGELLTVSRAAEPGAFVPYSTADQVHFNHPSAAWPSAAAGQGASLNRISYLDYGNDVLNWQAGVPTPGRPNVDVTSIARVVARQVFYNNSIFDGDNSAPNAADLNAIAWEKRALFTGQTASFANYTNYSKGINGVLVQIRHIANIAALDADDFVFRIGKSNAAATWPLAPPPSSITVEPGVTAADPDRVRIIWPDGAVRQTWLSITIKANETTGLESDDVFLFGNAIGETGNSVGQAIVDFADALGPRRLMNTSALVTHPYDFDRNGVVDAVDLAIVLAQATGPSGDLDGSGGVGTADVARFVQHLAIESRTHTRAIYPAITRLRCMTWRS